MSTLNKILIVVVIMLAVLLLALLVWQGNIFQKPYYAVYLSTGDLYFGKLDTFPKLALNEVWFLQQNQNSSETPFRLQKFEDAFWQPRSKMYINEDMMVWKTKLRNNSQVVEFIKNGGNTGQTQVPTPTDTQVPLPTESGASESDNE